MIVLESQYSVKTPEEVLAGGGWDVRAIQSAGGNRVTFQDTRNRGKWPQYSRLKVPGADSSFRPSTSIAATRRPTSSSRWPSSKTIFAPA